MKKEEITVKLSVIVDLLNNRKDHFHSQQKGHQGLRDNEEYQGEYNETFKFYQHKDLPKNLFLRETYHTDSYGYNDSLVKVDFVEGIEKQITVFEPIV